jgi:DNA-binding transcriptional LysR family regulator
MSSITISSPGTTLTDVIAPFLATWEPADPMPTVWERLPAQIYPSLEAGADLAVGTTPPPGHLANLPVAALPVWAYVPPSHPWESRSTVTLEELARQNLLVLRPEQHSRQALDAALLENAIGLDAATEFGTPEVAQAVAAAGRGVAVVSDDPRFGLIPVRITNGHRLLVIRLYAAWTTDHHAAAAIEGIARRLNTFCQTRYAGSQINLETRR